MAPKTVWLGFAMLAIALACGKDSTGAPVISTLQNDNFTSGGGASFQNGFVSGEAAAVRLGPQTAAFTIRRVLFLFGGDTATKTLTLTIYNDNDVNTPGTVLHSDDYSIKGSDNAMQEIDLTSQHIHVAANQKIRVALQFSHTGAPGVAIDGAITTGRNLIYSGGWNTAESFALPGDFIIRAEISTP